MDKLIEKAGVLIEALPYIQQFRNEIVVVKFGGSAMEDPEHVEGVLADVTFMECVGMKLVLVHGGGKVMLVGLYEQPISWDPSIVVNKSVTLIGCLGGSFPRAIELLQSGSANAKLLISHQFPLDQAKEAFETQLGAQDTVKVLVKP